MRCEAALSGMSHLEMIELSGSWQKHDLGESLKLMQIFL